MLRSIRPKRAPAVLTAREITITCQQHLARTIVENARDRGGRSHRGACESAPTWASPTEPDDGLHRRPEAAGQHHGALDRRRAILARPERSSPVSFQA